MFEKWTKKVSSKATDGAVEGIKETLNEKLDTYSGIIKIGLTIGVIIFGSIKINDHHNKRQAFGGNPGYSYGMQRYQDYPQQPIIINNYISDGRQHPYGRQKENYRKH